LAELRAARRSERAWSAAMAALRSSGAGACAIQRCRSNPARGASPGDLFASGPHMTIERRRFLQGALAAPLMLSSAAALAKQSVPPGADWNTWFHGWFGRDFGMIGYYAEDNAQLLASREPVDIVFF